MPARWQYKQVFPGTEDTLLYCGTLGPSVNAATAQLSGADGGTVVGESAMEHTAVAAPVILVLTGVANAQ